MNKVKLKLVKSVSTDINVGNEVILNGEKLSDVADISYGLRTADAHGWIAITLLADVTVEYHEEGGK